MNHADRAPAGSPEPMAHRVERLESELATLRREMARLQRPASGPSPEALRAQSEAWDLVLGLTPEIRQQRAQAGPGKPTFEDASLRFVSQHAGKFWIALMLLAALAIAFRDRLA